MPKYAIMSYDCIYGKDHNGEDTWDDIGGPDWESVLGAYDDNTCYTLFDSEEEAKAKVKELREGGYDDELVVWEMEEVTCYRFSDEV